MKTLSIYISLLLFLLVSISFAQVTVGVKINNPLFYGSSAGKFKALSGEELTHWGNWGVLNAGAFVRLPLKKHWVLHSELLYKNEGAHYYYTTTQSRGEASHFAYDYIDMPILLQFEGKCIFRGFLQLGLSPKFLLSASYNQEEFEATNVYDNFNKVVLTAQIGGGILWDIKRVVLMVDMRISPNLTAIAGKVRDVDFSSARSFSITTVSVSVGYKLTKLSSSIKQ
jgi:hypothetical protein